MPLKILLIEDNPDHIEITKRILRKASGDYQLDFAMDPEEGLKKIFEGPYDVVLCDYCLSSLTAFDILKQMNDKHNDTPLIVVTALGNEKVAVDMMKEGAYDYIAKDISYNDTLDMVIRKTIDRHRVKKEKEELEEKIRKAYIELKETQNQLIQAEKLSAVGRLASGVAHEVMNPLAIIMQSAEYLANKISPEQKEIMQMIIDNIKRADIIVRTLVDFSRKEEINIISEDINLILESSLVLIQHRIRQESIKIVKELKEGLPKVLVDKNKIEQVFVNILINAIQAMPNGGSIFIRTYTVEFDKPKGGVGRRIGDSFKLQEKVIVIEVEDTGVGIQEENIDKVFEPFFTTKGPGAGTGLGLVVTKNIITMHKGLIEIKSKVGEGTKVMVTLKTEEA